MIIMYNDIVNFINFIFRSVIFLVWVNNFIVWNFIFQVDFNVSY